MQPLHKLCVMCHSPLALGEANDAVVIKGEQHNAFVTVIGICCDDCFDAICYPSIMVVLATPRTPNDSVH